MRRGRDWAPPSCPDPATRLLMTEKSRGNPSRRESDAHVVDCVRTAVAWPFGQGQSVIIVIFIIIIISSSNRRSICQGSVTMRARGKLSHPTFIVLSTRPSHSQTAYRQVTKPGYPQAAVAAAVVTGNINSVPSPA